MIKVCNLRSWPNVYHKLLSTSLVTSSISSSLYPLSNNNSQYYTNLPPSKKHDKSGYLHVCVGEIYTCYTERFKLRKYSHIYGKKSKLLWSKSSIHVSNTHADCLITLDSLFYLST